MFECWGVAMERDFIIETIKELLNTCDDIELLYLIQSLLSGES